MENMNDNIKTDTAGRSPRDRAGDLVEGGPVSDPSAQSNALRRRTTYDLVKRLFDVVLSLVSLLLLAPLFVIIAVLIKLSSRGPILFRQRRIGQFGREFDFLKFRTVFVPDKDYFIDKGRDVSPVYRIESDPRVTAIGRFLRRYSLDEFPQFINVLRGEMSFVGPRPPITYELTMYEPRHWRRLNAIPGLTGLWQVQGRSYTTFDEMVRLDIRYIEHRSFWLDLKIMLKTPLAVIRGSSRY